MTQNPSISKLFRDQDRKMFAVILMHANSHVRQCNYLVVLYMLIHEHEYGVVHSCCNVYVIAIVVKTLQLLRIEIVYPISNCRYMHECECMKTFHKNVFSTKYKLIYQYVYYYTPSIFTYIRQFTSIFSMNEYT